ncbi:MAG TPA: glycosyltransferase family 87 protein [Anaerolineales bacterium]|nr:glycosyltransferase family 87 protein [Anaerolineales bacterium]
MKFPGKVLLFAFFIVLLLALMIAVARYVPNSLHTNSDFLAIYDADLRLLQHITPYDYSGQIRLIAEQSGTLPENVYVPQFPYPPWFALSTFYLGLLPIQSAAMLWFEINLVMLFLTVWFLSAGWPPRLRLFSFLAPFFFIPVIGTLGVGQYDFPVLLGSAMLIYAVRQQRLAPASVGAALLTFKPHVGLPILLAALLYFFLSGGPFSRRALVWIFGGMAFLGLLGLVADPAWLIDYPHSFLTYQSGADIASCAACDSLPAWLAARFIPSPSLAQMTGIGAALFMVLLLFFGLIRARLLKAPAHLINAAILVALLALPHLYNYDFVLLLIPFALFAGEASRRCERIGLAVLYLFPFFAIVVFGRSLGDPSLLFVTLVLAALLYVQARRLPQLDVSGRGA